MHFQPDQFYHIYNRGNNKRKLFFERDNYLFFLKKVRKEINPFCEIFSYCLMPNHYHLLIMTSETAYALHPLARKIGTVQSSYTQAINYRKKSTGSAFQQKAKAKLIENKWDHLFVCFNYIHQNPLAAGLVNKLEDWEFSSYQDYAGLRNGTLINRKLAAEYVDFPDDPVEFERMSYDVMEYPKVRYVIF